MYTSKSRTLSIKKCTNLEQKEDSGVSSTKATTPIAPRRSLTDDECSPIQIRCTQDGGDDDIDVIWDWNSPQSRIKKINTKQRKRHINISPHIPRKLPMKHNLIPKFASLKAELEKLSNNTEINAVPVKELSDVDELANVISECDDVNSDNCDALNSSDLFGDDSFDDDLVKCSQRIEEVFCKPQPKTIEMLINGNTNIADDSFDAVLEDFTDEEIARLSQDSPDVKSSIEHNLISDLQISPIKNSMNNLVFDSEFSNVKSPVKYNLTSHQVTPIKNSFRNYETEVTPTKNSRTIYRTNSTPVRSDRVELMPRTKSADNYEIPRPNSPVIQFSPEEIERKRMEAKLKLELRKKEKEIEKKRLEAMERLKKHKMERGKPRNNSS